MLLRIVSTVLQIFYVQCIWSASNQQIKLFLCEMLEEGDLYVP